MLFAEIYMTFPEEGDSGNQNWSFIDEAHLIFNEGVKRCFLQIETDGETLSCSKGVGILFYYANLDDSWKSFKHN